MADATTVDEDPSQQPPRRFRLPLPEFTALSYRNYRFWWVSSVTVLFNQNMTQLAMAWLILDLTGSVGWASLVVFASGAPSFLLFIPAGLLMDRVDRRRLLMAAQTLGLVNSLALALAVTTGAITPGISLFFAVIAGISNALSQPSRQALLPSLLPREHLMNGIVVGNLAQNMAQLVGPAIAGVLIATVSISAAFYTLAGLMVIGIASLSLVRVTANVTTTRRVTPRELFGGITFLWGNRPLLIVAALYIATGIWVGGPIQALVPVLIRDFYHQDSSALGFAFSVQAVGAIVTALLITSAGSMRNKGGFFAFSMILGGGSLAGYGLAPSYTVVLLFFFTFGCATAFYSNMSQTILQTHSPPELLGRVLSIVTLSIQGFIPLGALQAGFVASLFDARIAAAYGGFTALTLGVLAISLSPRFRKIE